MSENRVALYRLMAQALAYPDRTFTQNMLEAVGKINLEFYDDPTLPFAPLLQELGDLQELPLDQVQGEHTRLFVNAYPHVPCPPYESAYVDGEMLGSAAEEVAALYRQWGLATDGELVDHAGTELEFMAFLLTLNTPEAIETANAFQVVHVARWLPRFAQDLIYASRLRFYHAVGQLLAAILRRESVLI